jgi:molybdenum cofactor biosynthesis enzyme MoaA
MLEYKEYYTLLSEICLNVTDACNFGCKYCFVE